MFNTIIRHFQRRFLHREDYTVLLLRLLLLTIVIAVIYLIFSPQHKTTREQDKSILLNANEILPDKPFRMATTHVCAAVLEAALHMKENNTIELTYLKRQDSTSAFLPIDPPVVHVVKNGDCIPAIALCERTSFKYCFTIDTNQSPARVNYEVREL